MVRQVERSELANCANCACFNLRKVTRAVTQFYDDMMRPSGLRATQFSLLVAARLVGPVSVTRLAELTVMDRTTLTRNLELLQKQGLIEVTAGEDRRTRIVTITAQGNAALARALPLWKKAQSHVVETLSEARWSTMLLDLSEMVTLAQQN
jgi:DNA-binding MarR family transcriptional regulator